MLTTLTTMLGLAPLALFAEGQARFLQPMAVSLFFGLALATALILLVVPCFYHILEDLLTLTRRIARPDRNGARPDLPAPESEGPL
ncbi:MAG: efflux RND transporter permease subunit [Planctomycetota bacterium]